MVFFKHAVRRDMQDTPRGTIEKMYGGGKPPKNRAFKLQFYSPYLNFNSRHADIKQ